jgi:hypothetical protein
MRIKFEQQWLLALLAFVVVVCHFFSYAAGTSISVYLYKCAACCLGVLLFPVLALAYNEVSMYKLMAILINNQVAREKAEVKMRRGAKFWKLPLIIHICCGGVFIYFIREPHLIIAFIFMMYYYRITHFILASSTIRHLNTLDKEDKENK